MVDSAIGAHKIDGHAVRAEPAVPREENESPTEVEQEPSGPAEILDQNELQLQPTVHPVVFKFIYI